MPMRVAIVTAIQDPNGDGPIDAVMSVEEPQSQRRARRFRCCSSTRLQARRCCIGKVCVPVSYTLTGLRGVQVSDRALDFKVALTTILQCQRSSRVECCHSTAAHYDMRRAYRSLAQHSNFTEFEALPDSRRSSNAKYMHFLGISEIFLAVDWQ